MNAPFNFTMVRHSSVTLSTQVALERTAKNTTFSNGNEIEEVANSPWFTEHSYHPGIKNIFLHNMF